MRYGAADLGYAVLTLTLHFSAKALAGGAMCKDINGSSIETGHLYIPGPKPCTICLCENGNPTICKAVLCKYKDQESLPNKDCKTFRFGNNCCELICLDDTLSSTTNDKTDVNELRPQLIGFLIIAVFFVILIILLIRLKQNKIRAGQQTNQLGEDQRSLGSMGYLDRNNLQHGLPMDDLPCNGYPLWKPPSNYFPRGEAPPPYEEAVAAARAEQALLSVNQHTLSPLNFANNYLMDHNAHTNVSIVTNSQNGLPASSPTLSQNTASNTSPAISTNSRPLSSPAAHNCYQLNQTTSATSDFCAGTCASFAISNNTYENLPTPGNRSALSNSVSSISPQHILSSSNQVLSSNSQNPSTQNFRQHTTLPRQGGAFTISASLANSQAEVHRTIPRSLATSGSLRLRREYSMHQSAAPLFDKPLISPKNTVGDGERSPRATVSSTILPSSVPSTFSSGDAAVRTNAFYDNSSCSRETPSTPAKVLETKSTDVSTSLCNYKPPLAAANEVNEEGSFDSVTCTCNAQVLPPLHDDTDDYRSECENCKSANGSRYYLDNEDELVTSPHETMTLQRRPEDTTSSTTPQYYRTSLTLPTNTRSRSRSTSSRGNWFSSMPESSTESSDND